MSGTPSAFTSGVKCLRALEHLHRCGESQTEQGHALRAQLEGIWNTLTVEEQDLLDGLSSDLRSSAEDLSLEDLRSRIQHVPSLAPLTPPGFGWDPYMLENE
jgi:hypothetical protein